MSIATEVLNKYNEACDELNSLNPAINKLRTCDFTAIQMFNDACTAPRSEQRELFQHLIDFCIDLKLEKQYYENRT